MNVTWEVDESKSLVRVIAEFDSTEIAALELGRLDMALLREPHEQPADILLKAEMIARRISQRRAIPTKPDGHTDPYKRCQHDLLKPATTIEVIDKWKAKCLVCIEFFDLPGQPTPGEGGSHG